MRKLVYMLFVICLCVSGCSDEAMLVSEQVFFGGDTEVAPGESTIGELPEDLQVLLFGDRDDYMEQLLGLPDHADEKVAVWDHRWEFWPEVHKNFMELEEAREWLLDQICLIDAQRDYYTKYIDAGGVAVMGHYRVDDAHFYNAREVILTMTSKRPELRERLTPDYRYAIAGSTTGPKSPTRFRMVLWENQTGFPAMPEKLPHGFSNVGSCGGWCYALVSNWTGRFWSDYSVVVHEFAHAIHYAINDFHIPGNPVHVEIDKLDTTFQARLEAAYAVAKANAVEEMPVPHDKYATWDYAMTNVKEYWAEGVTYWFEYLSQVWPEGDIFQGRLHYHDSFRKKDPLLYALLDEWFPLLTIEVTINDQ